MKVKEIPIASLVFDYKFYPRQHVDNINVRSLVNALQAGAELPPIVVDEKTKCVIDGWHRSQAWRRVFGSDAKIPAQVITYADDASMLEDSIRRNGDHGQRLGAADQMHCALQAEEVGLSLERVAIALNMTVEKYESLTKRKIGQLSTGRATVLKATLQPFAGQALTPNQAEANQRAGGMRAIFYVNQVINLLENDLIDWDDVGLTTRMMRLRELLTKDTTRIAS